MTNNKQKNIPEGWSQVQLQDVCQIMKGQGLSKIKLDKKGKYECILYGELYTTYNENIDIVKSKTNFNEGIRSVVGDILIPASTTTSHIDLAVASSLNSDNVLLGGDINILRKKDNSYNSKFLANCLTHAKKFELARLAQGFTIVHLYGKDFKEIVITLPSLLEQNNIIEVLETWDEYLEELLKKIEVKKKIKKGLMQNLLSGEVRLRGFDGKWEKIKLGDIGVIRTSSVDKKRVEGEKEVGLLNYMDVYRKDHISRGDIFQKVTANDQKIISSNLKQGDVLFTPSSETPDDIGHSAVVLEDLNNVVFSYHLMRFRPNKNTINYGFSAYCFKTHKFYLELWKKSQGATRFTLSKDALEKSKITIPKDTKEQEAIAEVLTTADQEIEALEEKKKIIEAQKKYLLNNLVTGKIRVPV